MSRIRVVGQIIEATAVVVALMVLRLCRPLLPADVVRRWALSLDARLEAMTV